MIASGRMKEYELDKSQGHRYLRIPTASKREQKKLPYVIDSYKSNVDKFSQLTDDMKFLDFSDMEIDQVMKVLAAILLLGDIKFDALKGEAQAKVVNPHVAEKVAKILQLDCRKFQWALVYYCRVKDGTPLMCHHSPDAARDARDTLAATMFQRLVDYVVTKINQKLAVGRAL
jgi:myosin heavy subunit